MFDHITNPHTRELAEALYKRAEFSKCNAKEILEALKEVTEACQKFPQCEATTK